MKTVIWITIVTASVVALHTNWENIAPKVLSAHSVISDMFDRVIGDARAIHVKAFNHTFTKQNVHHLPIPVITPPHPPQPITQDKLINDINDLLLRSAKS